MRPRARRRYRVRRPDRQRPQGGTVFGPYRYHCPIHGQSDPYVFRSQADRFGEDHRTQYHGGMHPPGGECVLRDGELTAPQGGERSAVLVFAVIMLLAFGAKLLGLV